MPEVMTRTVEGTHAGLPRKVMGNRERRTTDGKWVTPAAREVLRAAGMQTASTYISHMQGTVEQWAALRLVFIFCAQDQGFEGWWGVRGGAVLAKRGA